MFLKPLDIYNIRGPRQYEYLKMIRKNYLNYFNEDGTVKNEMKENLICEIHAKIGRAWNVGKCKIRRCFVDNKCLIPDIAYEKRKGNGEEIIVTLPIIF